MSTACHSGCKRHDELIEMLKQEENAHDELVEMLKQEENERNVAVAEHYKALRAYHTLARATGHCGPNLSDRCWACTELDRACQA